jgi:hypothetical protein
LSLTFVGKRLKAAYFRFGYRHDLLGFVLHNICVIVQYTTKESKALTDEYNTLKDETHKIEKIRASVKAILHNAEPQQDGHGKIALPAIVFIKMAIATHLKNFASFAC